MLRSRTAAFLITPGFAQSAGDRGFSRSLSKNVVRCYLSSPQVDDEVTAPPVPARERRAWTLSLDDVRVGVHARLHFVEFLQSVWSDEDFLDRAELIFGELLGNVVRHAPGPVEIFCDLDDDSIVLHVIDSGPPLKSAKRRLPDDVLSERGRGLFIVAQLASDVRIEPARDHGNHISVKLKL